MSKNYFITGATLSDGSKKNMYISDGKIAGYENPAGSKALVIEADGKVILPGLVDLHTHLREPGKEDSETVLSASRAGAKGGFTEVFLSKLKEQSFTIILMVGMLIYQNKIYNEQVDRYEKIVDEKQQYIDKLIEDQRQRSILREQYLLQQRDAYVDDLIGERKK